MTIAPYLTTEQRYLGRMKALEARSRCSKIKKDLNLGIISLEEILDLGKTDPQIGRIRILKLLTYIPGVGIKRAELLLEECDISIRRRLKGIGKIQREKLLSKISQL